MSKRLQVLIEDAEYRTLQQAARGRGMTVAEWVRQVLRASWRQEPTGSVERKLASLRASSRHSFPAPDIHQMLDEIERGYREKTP